MVSFVSSRQAFVEKVKWSVPGKSAVIEARDVLDEIDSLQEF